MTNSSRMPPCEWRSTEAADGLANATMHLGPWLCLYLRVCGRTGWGGLRYTGRARRSFSVSRIINHNPVLSELIVDRARLEYLSSLRRRWRSGFGRFPLIIVRCIIGLWKTTGDRVNIVLGFGESRDVMFITPDLPVRLGMRRCRRHFITCATSCIKSSKCARLTEFPDFANHSTYRVQSKLAPAGCLARAGCGKSRQRRVSVSVWTF